MTDALANHPALGDFQRTRVPAGEEYAANCVRINERVLIATGHPGVERILEELAIAPPRSTCRNSIRWMAG